MLTKNSVFSVKIPVNNLNEISISIHVNVISIPIFVDLSHYLLFLAEKHFAFCFFHQEIPEQHNDFAQGLSSKSNCMIKHIFICFFR